MTDISLAELTFTEQEPSSVGEILKSARLERGLTLEQVSENLRINKRHLSHLEANEVFLVCDVYTLGFIKLYAQYLELNTQDLIQRFKKQVPYHPKPPQLIFPAPLPGRGMPSFPILALSFVVLVVIVLGWKWSGNLSVPPYPSPELFHRNDLGAGVKVEVPALSTIQPWSVPNDPLEIPPLEAIPSNPDSPSQKVHLYVTGKTWIEVKDADENIIISRLFHPGESFEFENSENLILKTANLKETHLSSGERIFPGSGSPGEVGQEIPLNPEKWLEQDPENH
jgi:cytoskeleton protein RodZ